MAYKVLGGRTDERPNGEDHIKKLILKKCDGNALVGLFWLTTTCYWRQDPVNVFHILREIS
jgi:hypothetical protein